MSSGDEASHVIRFKAEDKRQCFDIVNANTVIYGSVGKHGDGSSKVKLKNIVDYNWEAKDYPGHLIAVHLDGKLIAYAIKALVAVSNKSNRVEGMVRVVNGTSSGQRALIKRMCGEVLDLQFAHLQNEHILGCIDEKAIHIHKIDKISESLICNLILRVDDPLQNYTPKYDKLSWCPCIPPVSPGENDISDISHLVVWARGGVFQCFNVNTIIMSNGIGKHNAENLSAGYIKWENSSLVITWILLSPDGSTLGVGSDDGYIRFYQMYFHAKEPRCLHEWKPHDGKIVSSFFFLENLTTPSEAYWKFALTGAEGNTEFKIWDCSTWSCLQTISFVSHDGKKSSFIAEIDRTSSYLVLTNRETRGLYVLQVLKQIENKNDKNDSTDESSQSQNGDDENNRSHFSNKKSNFAFIKSVSEFPLPYSVLSFSIVDAAVRKYKCALNENFVDELEDYDEDNNAIFCVVVRLFIVQPKSVQECHILYQPSVCDSFELRSSLSNESVAEMEDFLTDIPSITNSNQDKSTIIENSNINGLQLLENALLENAQTSKSPTMEKLSPNIQNNANNNSLKNTTSSSQLNLMIPEQFTAPVSNTDGNSSSKPSDCVSSEVFSTLLMLASVTGSTNNAVKNVERNSLKELLNSQAIEYQEKRKSTEQRKHLRKIVGRSQQQNNSDVLASGNSSPSREVQEIMSLTMFNDDNKQQEDEGFAQHITNDLINVDDDTVKTTKTTDWPKVPDVRSVIKHSSIQNPPNMISSTSLEINNLTLKINQLIDLIQIQSSEISSLKSEVSELKKTKNTANNKMPEISAEFGIKLEKQLSRMLEEYLMRCERDHNKKLDAFISARDAQSRDMMWVNQFAEKITNTLIIEIQRNVVPIIAEKLDIITKKIEADVAKKLTTTDSVLRENISQVCKSKSIIDAFGNSVLLGVKNGLQSAYVESMSTTLIPAYEKSSREMFKQLHDTFSLGITEVMNRFDSYLTQLQPVEGTIDEILEKICEFQKQFDQNVAKTRGSSEISNEIKKDIKIIECNMIRNLTDLIQHEIRKGFESQAASLEDSVLSAVRSQAHTPAPMVYDVQDQIKLLLSQGQINKAFHQALIANDLSLVEYTLEKANYKSVFNPCILEQTVLLSLIQHISADMNNHSDIKQRYLSDAILNLNLNDPISKEHAPKVLRELYKNCQGFLNTYPKNPLCSNIKMVMMAINGLGYKIF